MRVQIIIVGGIHSGKSTLGQEIEEHLSDLGINTELAEGYIAERVFSKEQRRKNIEALVKKRLEVEILTCQTARRVLGRRDD